MELPVIINSAPKAEGGGYSSSGCGTAPDALSHLPDHIRAKVQDHPCYSEEAHHYFARMHVAVAPARNIQCNCCNRKYDCSNESRPGVVSELLTPDQAIKKVLAVAAEIPQMTVLGIAGPGDPLANPGRTFETFEQLSERAPDIKLCVSTNGLNLPQYVDRIAAFGNAPIEFPAAADRRPGTRGARSCTGSPGRRKQDPKLRNTCPKAMWTSCEAGCTGPMPSEAGKTKTGQVMIT